MRHPLPGHSFGMLPYIMQGVFSLIFLALLVTLVIVLVKKYRKGNLHLPPFAPMAPNP